MGFEPLLTDAGRRLAAAAIAGAAVGVRDAGLSEVRQRADRRAFRIVAVDVAVAIVVNPVGADFGGARIDGRAVVVAIRRRTVRTQGATRIAVAIAIVVDTRWWRPADDLELANRGAPAAFLVVALAVLVDMPEGAGHGIDIGGGVVTRAGRAGLLGRATTRTFDPSEGYGEMMEIELTAPEIAELAGLLAEGDPSSFPANLWADSYTDLTIQVLDKKKSVRARQFARLSPSTHGQLQLDFNSIYGSLQALHQRVLEAGRPAGDG